MCYDCYQQFDLKKYWYWYIDIAGLGRLMRLMELMRLVPCQWGSHPDSEAYLLTMVSSHSMMIMKLAILALGNWTKKVEELHNTAKKKRLISSRIVRIKYTNPGLLWHDFTKMAVSLLILVRFQNSKFGMLRASAPISLTSLWCCARREARDDVTGLNSPKMVRFGWLKKLDPLKKAMVTNGLRYHPLHPCKVWCRSVHKLLSNFGTKNRRQTPIIVWLMTD